MYTPPAEILQSYAKVLVTFALGSGNGIKPGETVFVNVPECAKPMYVPLQRAIIEAGGHALMQFTADDVDVATTMSLMSEEQLSFFPAAYYKGIVEQADHSIAIIAEHNKFELKDLDPEKLMKRMRSFLPYRQWRDVKEQEGNFTWTLALYGTPAMAAEVGLTEEAYWQQIIAACYLDEADPVAKWREVQAELERVRQALNNLHIEKVHMEGQDADLVVGIGEGRQWLGGSGRNIPSFELFTSPNKHLTEGWIRFNQPLYTHGNRISGIKLTFKAGSITEIEATENKGLLEEMIATEGANMLGEFSLTDGRLSRITQVMAETLYDENMGGPEGNTHVAIGNAYKDAFSGKASELQSEDWQRLGFNESVVHTDIISTAPRKVTATLPDGTTRVIYEGGQFTL